METPAVPYPKNEGEPLQKKLNDVVAVNLVPHAMRNRGSGLNHQDPPPDVDVMRASIAVTAVEVPGEHQIDSASLAA
jgi:hypothetical protein